MPNRNMATTDTASSKPRIPRRWMKCPAPGINQARATIPIQERAGADVFSTASAIDPSLAWGAVPARDYCFCRAMIFVLDFVVSSARDDVLLRQLGLRVVRTIVDDPLGVCVADTGKRFQFVDRSRI